MSNIILIQDLLNSRKRKEQELEFYALKLSELEGKRALLMHEIQLTNQILSLIRKEQLQEIKG